METSLKTGFAQIFSRCPKNLSCPKFGEAAAPLAPPARTPMCRMCGKTVETLSHVLSGRSALAQSTVNPLFTPLGGLFISSPFEAGLDRDGGLI